MNIKGNAAKVGVATMLSRIAGYLRDMLMAQLLGAGAVVEAFQVAFSFPNLFRNLFGEGAMNAALIPRYALVHQQQGKLAAQQFFGDVLLLVGGLMLLLSVLGYLFMPSIIGVLAWGFDDAEKLALTITLARLCLPYLTCIILVALFAGVLNHSGRYFLPAALPIVLNAMLVGALLWGLFRSDTFDVRMLAVAVVVAGVLQFAICVGLACLAGVLPQFGHRFRHTDMQAFVLLMLPGVISGLFLQINFLTNRAFASTLGEGAIAWLFYAERLFQLPLALIGISLGIALLPMLSQAVSRHDFAVVTRLADKAIHTALFWSFPAAIGLGLCADLVVIVLFERGAFTRADTLGTAAALHMLCTGLPAYIMVKVLQPLFFARHNTRTPMLISLGMMVVNIALSLLLMPYLAHVGLALATAISGWIHVAVLCWRLGADCPLQWSLWRFITGVVLANVGLAAMIFGLRYGLPFSIASAPLELSLIVVLSLLFYVLAGPLLTGYHWQNIFKVYGSPQQ